MPRAPGDRPEPAPAPPLDQRFPRALRLRRSADFRWVQGRGKRVKMPRILVLFTPGRAPQSRFGLVVSRKVGNAVRRNRVKRWLREAIRRNRRVLQGRWDLAIIAHPSAAQAGLLVLESELREALSRMNRPRP